MYLCIEMEERLDKLLVELGLVATRSEAEKLILEVGVNIDGKLITKPGKKFSIISNIKLVSNQQEFSSLNAVKISSAIKKWKLAVEGGSFLDIFSEEAIASEVLLFLNASKVFINEPSKNSFKNIPFSEKVVDLTGIFLREISIKNTGNLLDGCVLNASDESLMKSLPFVHPLLRQNGFVLAIIRPKVEVEKSALKNNGKIRNSLVYPAMFEQIKSTSFINNLDLIDYIKSPIIGKDGEEEFILYLRKK